MKKIKYIIGVALATMLIACSSDYEHYISGVEVPETPTEIYFTADELLVLMQMRNPDNRICIDEATEIALDAISFFNGTTTRSGQARTIVGITALQSEPGTRMAMATRSTNGSDVEIQIPDTVAFVFNFADDSGFTIVAADTRITSPVLAFVDDGNLDLSKEVDHPGLAIFFEGLEEYIEYSIMVAEKKRDSLMAGILERLSKDTEAGTRWAWCCCDGGPSDRLCFCIFECQCPRILRETQIIRRPGPWTTGGRMGPFLPVEWGQGFPFNRLMYPTFVHAPRCPITQENPTGRGVVGCTGVAIAMILTYWGHPSRFVCDFANMLDPNWNLLDSFTARPNAWIGAGHLQVPTSRFGFHSEEEKEFIHEVGLLMRHVTNLTRHSIIRCHVWDSPDPREFNNAIDALRGMRYSFDNKRGYNTQAVINSLNNHHPVLIRGARNRSTTWLLPNRYSNWYTWVIDGLLRRNRQTEITVITRTTTIYNQTTHRVEYDIWTQVIAEQPIFLHNNWGLDGSNNGWFVEGVFDTSRRVFNSSSFEEECSAYGINHNFQFSTEIVTNIRR